MIISILFDKSTQHDINFAKKIINNNYVDLICNARKFIYEPNFILKELSKLNPKTKLFQMSKEDVTRYK